MQGGDAFKRESETGEKKIDSLTKFDFGELVKLSCNAVRHAGLHVRNAGTFCPPPPRGCGSVAIWKRRTVCSFFILCSSPLFLLRAHSIEGTL